MGSMESRGFLKVEEQGRRGESGGGKNSQREMRYCCFEYGGRVQEPRNAGGLWNLEKARRWSLP